MKKRVLLSLFAFAILQGETQNYFLSPSLQSVGTSPANSGDIKFESLEKEKAEQKKKEEEEFKKNSVAEKMARGEKISEPESITFYPQWAGWLFGATDMQFSFLLGKERKMVSFVANTGSRFNFNKLKASTLGADGGFSLALKWIGFGLGGYGKNTLYFIPIGGEIAYTHLFNGYSNFGRWDGSSFSVALGVLHHFGIGSYCGSSAGGSNLDYTEIYLSLSGNNVSSVSYIGSMGVTLGYVVHSNQELKIAGKSIGGFSPLKNAFKIGFTWKL